MAIIKSWHGWKLLNNCYHLVTKNSLSKGRQFPIIAMKQNNRQNLVEIT